jgi:hypothetical protein
MIGRSLALLAMVLVCVVSTRASAQDHFYGPRSEYSPSVFTYGYRGLTVGAIGGLSGGYLVARHDGFQGRDWRPLVLGAGIGALSGAALGLGLGFLDLADDRPGMGNIALRDMAYGGGFGAVVGLIVGGLVVIKTRDAEHIPFGAAVGALSGIGVGLIVGLIEGRRIVNSPQHRYSGKGIAPALFAVEDVRERLAWSAGARGRF